jgi:undecaprenyl-diphosphatase
MSALARELIEWDRQTFVAVNNGMKSPALDYVMPAITQLGLGQVQAVVVLGLAVYLGYRAGELYHGKLRWGMRGAIVARRSWVAPLLLSYVLGGLAVTAMKVIPRNRPWWHYLHQHQAGRDLDVKVYTVEGVHPLRVRGFPSGHTATTTGMATVLTVLYFRRRYGIWLAAGLWVLAALVAASRIYLASHWPLDIVAGAAIGVAAGLLSVWICRKWALISESRRVGASDQAAGDSL